MTRLPNVVNVRDIAEIDMENGTPWGGAYKPLPPVLDQDAGRLGANLSRVPPGRTMGPFHSHQLEDEIFYVLSGRGILRYGDRIQEIGPGDCVSCPAGVGTAHQIANPFDQDLVYLAIGRNDPNEVCVYPDSGKIKVRGLDCIGVLAPKSYLEGEPDQPRIFGLADKQSR
ncbi:MAG: cupin domain-containing protein [Telmatospirillum sp.]|nr:cupin domain-containing protein [Telmatospirillum sp.]